MTIHNFLQKTVITDFEQFENEVIIQDACRIYGENIPLTIEEGELKLRREDHNIVINFHDQMSVYYIIVEINAKFMV